MYVLVFTNLKIYKIRSQKIKLINVKNNFVSVAKERKQLFYDQFVSKVLINCFLFIFLIRAFLKFNIIVFCTLLNVNEYNHLIKKMF